MKLDTFIKIAGMMALVVMSLLLIKSCTKPPRVITVVEDVMVIDSVSVQTLRSELAELKNKLNAQPKVIVVTHTVHDTLEVTDTLTVYPVGSINKRRDYAFNVTANNDSISLKVNTDLFSYVYTDHNNKFYQEDSLRVWLTDIIVRNRTIAPQPKMTGTLYVMGGLGVSRYQQVVSNQSIVQTDVQPMLGVGYMRNVWGGYIMGAPNGINAGITANMSHLLKGIFYK